MFRYHSSLLLSAGIAGLLLSSCAGEELLSTAEPKDDLQGQGDPEDQDVVPATLTVDNPVAAAWLPTGVVEIDGSSTGLRDVYLDHDPMELGTGGQFQGQLELSRGINSFQVDGLPKASDEEPLFERRSVLAGQFADPDLPLERGIEVRLNRSGLDLAADSALHLFDPQALQDYGTALNPIYQDTYTIWDWIDVDLEVDLARLDFASPSLAIEPIPDQLEVTAGLSDLQASMIVTADLLGYQEQAQLELWADLAEYRCTLLPVLDSDGLTLAITASEITLDGFLFDLSGLSDALEEALLADALRPVVEDLLVEHFSTSLPPVVDEMLTSLTVSKDMTILGQTVQVDASLGELAIDEMGIEAAIDFEMASTAGAHDVFQGYLLSGGTTTSPNAESSLSLALSDDLANRLALEIWRTGAWDLEYDFEAGSFQALALQALEAEHGSMSVDMVLPPVVVHDGQELRLQFGEVVVDLNTPGGGLGEQVEMVLSGSGLIRYEIVDNALDIGLEDIEVVVMVRQSDWGVSNEQATLLIEERISMAGLISAMLVNWQIPLPAIDGLDLDGVEFSRAECQTLLDIS